MIEKLGSDKQGHYTLKGERVLPVLVYGPILYKWEVPDDSLVDPPIERIARTVKEDTGIDLERRANSYTSSALTLHFPEQNVPDGKISEQRIRHSIISFFKAHRIH